MDQRRKIILFATIGGMLLIGMLLSVSLRKGRNILASKQVAEINQQLGQVESNIPQPSNQKGSRVIGVEPQAFISAILSNHYRSTLVYVFTSECRSCYLEIGRMQKMRNFYSQYKIGVEFLDIDPQRLSETHAIFLKGAGFADPTPIYGPQGDILPFMSFFNPQARASAPAFIILNDQGKVLNYWEGETPTNIIDSRFRATFANH